MNLSSLKSYLSSLQYKVKVFSATPQKLRVLAHKSLLNNAGPSFSSFKDIVFVFQVFNKAKNCDKILAPFLQKGCANILIFADGCIDGSALAWHKKLLGKNHLVISANDLHEIRNYRLSLDIANHWGCSHVVLLQDDDIYDERLFEWLNSALKASSLYGAAIVGGNGGSDIDPSFSYKRADSGLMSAEFISDNNNSKPFYSLGHYQRMLLPSKFSAVNDIMPHTFVANVNRAPQLMNVKLARELNFFPKELEPYQYDDYYNCFKSWLNDYPIVLMPLVKVASDIGIGGMRLFNDVNIKNRPMHFIQNWNFVMDNFSDSFSKINEIVSACNRKWLT